MTATQSHTLRGCVDWNEKGRVESKTTERHTLRGCVDWNYIFRKAVYLLYSHTLRGCVDWNKILNNLPIFSSVTPYVGVWVETLQGDLWLGYAEFILYVRKGECILSKGIYVLEHSYHIACGGTYETELTTIQCAYAPEYASHSAGGTIVVNQCD